MNTPFPFPNAGRPSNRQIVLGRRPNGTPSADDFAIWHAEIPHVQPGEVLIRNLFLSVEPAMRGWVNIAANYGTPVPVGGLMPSFAVGEVIESRLDGFEVGDHLMGMFGWQEYCVAGAGAIKRKILERDLSVSLALGILGVNGITAYFGTVETARAARGETLLVSTAAGAVGSAVGQIAKILGCRVIGIAGGAEKTEWCKSLGFDVAVDYKAPTFAEELAAACKGGVDVFFDNTAGPVADEAAKHLSRGARVVVCGTSSIATWDPWPVGPRIERALLVKRASMTGFLVMDYEARYQEAVDWLAPHVRSGRLAFREDITDGLESAMPAIGELYSGVNRGKRLIRLGRA
ncbi:hypothetical protein DFR24_3266 [Panacagrimonas perspica]|uniref:Enoyl reductase (ER) domain-containing protein n=1 Tax=Panacagrimonas perspica TaxID=381431 RepID=A0A4S3K2R0_9GAMM|nr:NADP-dependent oxidoreductase [Panacagrimonas perspica]TDU28886.1 hypothetical protein DFR24_3266 [Panacagrimonas perspica]THD02287.1 hypothetical protein B1810_15275 [Panacagrimonas perspica]